MLVDKCYAVFYLAFSLNLWSQLILMNPEVVVFVRVRTYHETGIGARYTNDKINFEFLGLIPKMKIESGKVKKNLML